jgi:NADPH:quinone reductase-like Zn-dependent oxidoreductase
VDSLGEPALFRLSLASLAPGGTLVSSGAFLGRDVSVDLPRLYLNGQRIVGVRTGNRASAEALWAEAGRGFRPLLDKTFPLAEAARAHHYLEDERNTGRVALLVEPGNSDNKEGTTPCASTAC